LTAARTGEVISAEWADINLRDRVWTVPAQKMKGGKPHRVPLCGRAAEILRTLPHKSERPFALHETAMAKALATYRPGVTVHGFRSSFRDWCAERTNFPNHVVEMALADAIPSAVEAAYRRGDLFEKRRRLMEAWADYCAKPAPASATVTPLRAHADA
jgi:integrase